MRMVACLRHWLWLLCYQQKPHYFRVEGCFECKKDEMVFYLIVLIVLFLILVNCVRHTFDLFQRWNISYLQNFTAKINRCSSVVCLRVTVCSCFSNFLINFITHCNVHAAFLFPFHLFLALLEMLVSMISHLHWMLFKQCMLMLTCRIWRILVVNQKFKHTG